MSTIEKVRHTAGPWHIEMWPTEPCGIAPHILGMGESAIARLFVRDNDIDTPVESPEAEMQTNAQLIAAAPELLEALIEISKLYLCPEPKTMRDWSARVDVMADYARKAIAKAEGQS